jgi:hypothetical protein
MNVISEIEFKYKGKTYKYETEMENITLENAKYMWTEGNFSCDCNKAMFLGIDDDMSCGEEIKIEHYIMYYKPVPKLGLQSIWYDKKIGSGGFSVLECSAD